MKNNILSSERYGINVKKNCMLIGSYKVIIAINARQRSQVFKKKLFASNSNIILPHLEAIILFALVFLLNDRNFMFYLTTQVNLTLYIYIVDYTTTKIFVSNTSHCLLHILRHWKFGYIIDIYYNNYFLADS